MHFGVFNYTPSLLFITLEFDSTYYLQFTSDVVIRVNLNIFLIQGVLFLHNAYLIRL